ncbi:MAG TPA: hypothetical protein VL522_09005 [Bordetella sp.]|nr:hypothetical protein [Bordetella sp.]
MALYLLRGATQLPLSNSGSDEGMGTMDVRDVRAVFYYGANCEGSCAAADEGKPRQLDMGEMVATLEKWNKLSEDTRATHQQWMQCKNIEDGTRLRTQLARDLNAWAKARIAKSRESPP